MWRGFKNHRNVAIASQPRTADPDRRGNKLSPKVAVATWPDPGDRRSFRHGPIVASPIVAAIVGRLLRQTPPDVRHLKQDCLVAGIFHSLGNSHTRGGVSYTFLTAGHILPPRNSNQKRGSPTCVPFVTKEPRCGTGTWNSSLPAVRGGAPTPPAAGSWSLRPKGVELSKGKVDDRRQSRERSGRG